MLGLPTVPLRNVMAVAHDARLTPGLQLAGVCSVEEDADGLELMEVTGFRAKKRLYFGM